MATDQSQPLPITLPGTAAPVRMWLPEQEADAAALAQLRNIASLPWVHGVRVMPDMHLGIGATVGSVVIYGGASPARWASTRNFPALLADSAGMDAYVRDLQ